MSLELRFVDFRRKDDTFTLFLSDVAGCLEEVAGVPLHSKSTKRAISQFGVLDTTVQHGNGDVRDCQMRAQILHENEDPFQDSGQNNLLSNETLVDLVRHPANSELNLFVSQQQDPVVSHVLGHILASFEEKFVTDLLHVTAGEELGNNLVASKRPCPQTLNAEV